MKRTRTLALLTALVCLCVSLTACSPKEVLKSAILKTTTALGLRQETSDEDEVDDLSYATGGGDVTFPETMDTTASKLVSEVDGDTLYVAFNGIQNRSTNYLVAGSAMPPLSPPTRTSRLSRSPCGSCPTTRLPPAMSPPPPFTTPPTAPATSTMFPA